MATSDYSKFFEAIESYELNKVLNIPLIGSFCVRVLEVGEPFMLVGYIGKSLELISSERASLNFREKIGAIHRKNLWTNSFY